MELDYKVPASIDDFIYISQLLQANGVVEAIVSHRKARPYCMGTMYWQFNDCWPVISWSSTDYYGMPKALHYAVKRAYQDIIIVNELKDDTVNIWVVSDKTIGTHAKLTVELVDYNGKVFFGDKKLFNVAASSSEMVYSFPLIRTTKDSLTAGSCFLRLRLYLNNEARDLFTKYFYFEKPKDLVLQDPGVTVEKAGIDEVKVICKKYMAKDVYLYSDGLMFEDNFFDMMP